MSKDKKEKSTVSKPFYKKWWFWVIIVVVLVGIFGSIGGEKDEKGNTSPSVTAQGENQPSEETGGTEESEKSDSKTAEELSGKDAIREAIEGVVGEENLELFTYTPDDNYSLIKFKGQENLSSKLTIEGMYMDIFKILKAIQPIIDTDVDINVVYPLQDKYGNASDVLVIKSTFKNDTIQKINFDNAMWDNIPVMADDWWDHDAVKLSK